MSLTVAQLVARLTADTSGFYRGMAVANSSMIRTGGIISRVAAGAGLATLGMGILSLRAAGNFEESMNILQAVSGATEKQFAALKGEAIALGKDMNLPNVSAKDAAEAMQELAKGGLSVNDTLKATRGTLQLSTASNMSFSDSATVVARALKAFHLDGSKATQVADLFTAAANKSTADMTDMALGFQMASAQFKAGDQTISGLTTSLALMANAGIAGSDAGTSLKTMMNRLMAPTKKAKGVMEDMGFAVYDANGNMKPMPKIIDSLQQGLAGMTKEQKNATLYTIFGSDAIRASRVMLDAGSDGWLKMQSAITKGGEAQAFAEAKTKGFNGALGAAGSAVETLAITLGTALLPVAERVVRGFADWVNSLDPAKIIGFFSAIKDVVVFLWDFVAGTDAVQYALAALFGVFVGFKVLSSVVTMIKSVQLAWLALNATFALSPIGLIILAIAGLVAALALAYMKSEAFKEVVNRAFAAIRDFALPILISLKNAVIQFFNWIAPYVSSAMSAVVGFFKTHWGTIRTVLETAFTIMKGVITTAFNVWKSTIGAALISIVGFFRTHWGTIQSVVSTAFSIIKGIVTTGISVVKSVVATIASIVGVVRGIFNRVVEAVRNPLDTLKSIVRTIFNSLPGVIREAIGTVYSVATSIGKAIVDGVIEGVKSLPGRLKDKVVGAAQDAYNGVMGFLGASSPSKLFRDGPGKAIGEGIIVGFLLGVGNLPEKMTESVKKSLEAAKATVEAYQGRMREAFSRLASDALSAFDAITAAHLTKSEAALARIAKGEQAKQWADGMSDAQAKIDTSTREIGDALWELQQTEAQIAAARAAGDTTSETYINMLQKQTDLNQKMHDLDLARTEAEEAQAAIRLEKKKAALEVAAEKERIEYEAARTRQKTHLSDTLADLEEGLKKHPEKHAFYQKKIVALLKSYGVSYKTAGNALGVAFAKGMEDSFDEVEKSAKAIAALVARYLKLKSPADTGPLSDLDHWWDKFASTLVRGINPRVVEQASAALAGASRSVVGTGPSLGAYAPAVASSFAGAGGGSVVNYHTWQFGNYVGDKQDLMRTISTEVQRLNGRN